MGCRFPTITPLDELDAGVPDNIDGSIEGDRVAVDGRAPDLGAPGAVADLGPASSTDTGPSAFSDASSGCRWVPDPVDPTPLTVGAPTGLDGLVRAPDSAWVLWDGLDGEGGANGLHLQRASLSGARVGPAMSLRSLGGNRLSAAASAGRINLAASDGAAACHFTPLSEEGVAMGGSVLVTTGQCADLQPSPAGFSVLTVGPGCSTGGAIGYVRFDASGGSASPEVELVPATEGADVRARVVRPDGSFVLAWSSCDGHLSTRRFNVDGSPATARIEVTALGPDAGRLALTAVRDGMLAAWSRGDAATGFRVHVVALDADGRPRTTPGPLSAPQSGRSANLALAAWNGTAILVWTDALRSFGVAMRALPLTAMGEPTGGVLTLGEFGHDVQPMYPIAVPTLEGVLSVYLAARDPAPAPMQVYASRIRCLPFGR